jgi:threonine dehydratase
VKDEGGGRREEGGGSEPSPRASSAPEGQTLLPPPFSDVLAARERIADFVRRTPLVRSRWLSTATGGEVYLKLENFQATGSFKIRGAANCLALMEGERRPVVAASAGNHARAVAECAERFGIDATIVMARTAAPTKIAALREYAVELRLEGDDYDGAERAALELARLRGAVFVSPYNDPAVIAGQGTAALEIFEEASHLDALLVPTGGGGLLAGAAIVARAIGAGCAVIGVQPTAARTLASCHEARRQVDVEQDETIADGLSGNLEPGSITVPIILAGVDRFALVSEEAIAAAVRETIDREHVLIEPSAAVGIAALLAEPGQYAGRRVAVLITGANVGPERLRELLASR